MPSFAGVYEQSCIEGKNMARTRHKVSANAEDLRKNWVWCPAGSSIYVSRRRWIHWKTCKVRQSTALNDCVATCHWYKAIRKLEDPGERRIINLSDTVSKREVKTVQTELGNKKKLKKYMQSIPKEA